MMYRQSQLVKYISYFLSFLFFYQIFVSKRFENLGWIKGDGTEGSRAHAAKWNCFNAHGIPLYRISFYFIGAIISEGEVRFLFIFYLFINFPFIYYISK